jgi:hypothetical protein
MTDVLLFTITMGVVVLSLAVDLAAVIGWLQRRAR